MAHINVLFFNIAPKFI